MFPTDAKGYKSWDGEYIVLSNRGLGNNNYFSPDGKTFYQWYQTGWGGGVFHFVEPLKGTTGIVSFEDDHLVIDDGRDDKRIYRLTPIPENPVVLPLPHIRTQRNAGRLAQTGEWFYVSTDKYYYKPIKFYMGRVEKMEEVAGEFITAGNTMKVITSRGLLVCNGPFMNWEGIGLVQGFPENCSLAETETGLRIKINYLTKDM